MYATLVCFTFVDGCFNIFFYSFIIIVWGMGLKMGVGQPFLVCAVGFLYYYCEVGDEIV